MQKKIFIVLDIGTSYIKCSCVNSDHEILVAHQLRFPMIQVQNTYEIDFELFLETTKDLIARCLENRIIKELDIEALLITSQANTFVPVNTGFEPLCNGIVWLDERAGKEANYLNNELPDYSKYAGFERPFSGLYASKLLWLKQNKAPVFKQSAYFPLINEYLVYKLTGEYYSDATSFGMSGMYDYNKNRINYDLLQILELSNDNFPQIENAAKKGALISSNFMKELKLNYRFPVLLCGNDQGASALGAGLRTPGDININFGTAMVLYTITEKLNTDLNNAQIAGKHPVGNHYFLLNYETDFGIQIRRLKDLFFHEGSYDQVFKTYIEYPTADEQVPSFDSKDLSLIKSSEAHQYCAGIIKYYLKRLKKHLSQIRKTVDVNNIFISGGMSQSKLWLEILKSDLGIQFKVNHQAHAGIFGTIEIFQQNKILKK